MTTYTNIFGGTIVQIANPSYSSLSLSANTTLSWPTQFQDSNLVVPRILDVVPTANGFTLTLPDATQTSTGQDILITNPSAFSFSLLKNDGTPLMSPFSAGLSNYFYLIDNTTVGGTWRQVPFALGTAVVTSVAAVSSSSALTITGSPITNAGTFTFNIVGDLASINSLGSTGIGVRTASQTWGTVTIVGSTNISITNGNGIGGNPQISLNASLTGLTSAIIGNIGIGTVTANTISTTTGNLILSSSGTNNIIASSAINMNPSSGAAPQGIFFYNGAGTFYTCLIGGVTTANLTYVLPIVNGAANTLIQTDGNNPGNLSFSVASTRGIAKAWVAFTGNGAATVLDSYNVASVVRNGAGDYTVNFTTGFFNNNYAWSVTAGQGVAGTGGFVVNAAGGNNPISTAFRLFTLSLAGSQTDANYVSAIFFGRRSDE